MDYNKIIMLGRLTRDPELRYISSGTAVCEFGLATNHKYTRQGGETKEETCFVDVTVWGRAGENCKEYLKKGSAILLDGRLTFDTWTGPDGQRRSKHRVVADRVQFVGRPSGQRTEEPAAEGAAASESFQQYESTAGAASVDPEVPF